MKSVSPLRGFTRKRLTPAILPLRMFASSYEDEQNIAAIPGMKSMLSPYSRKSFIERSPYL
jgi:hypothetical protein